jgi:hypothetical protein
LKDLGIPSITVEEFWEDGDWRGLVHGVPPLHRLERLKEWSDMTRFTIQKIPDDHDMFLKA